MRPVKRLQRLRRGGLIVALVAALTAQSVQQATAAPAAVPGAAASTAAEPSPRAKVLTIWRSAGSQVKAEAEKALTGSDADVTAFLNDKLGRLSALDDRLSVNQILNAGGPTVKTAASRPSTPRTTTRTRCGPS